MKNPQTPEPTTVATPLNVCFWLILTNFTFFQIIISFTKQHQLFVVNIIFFNRKCALIRFSDWTHHQQPCHPANFLIPTVKVIPACSLPSGRLVKCQDFSSASHRQSKTSIQTTVGCSSEYSVTKTLRSCNGRHHLLL